MSSDFDIEYNRKKSSKSVLSTRNILITLGATVAVLLLVITGLYAKGYFDVATEVPIIQTETTSNDTPFNLNNPETVTTDDLISSDEDYNDNADMDPNLPSEPLLFAHDKTILRIDVNRLEGELKCEKICTADCLFTTIPQYSKDKKKLYFSGRENIEYYDFETETVEQLPIYKDSIIIQSNFFLKGFKKNEIIFVQCNKKRDTCSFRFFDLKTEKLTERVESHGCGSRDIPIIRSLSLDGTKLLYMCIMNQNLYLKDLTNPDEMDHRTHMTDLKAQNEISPDNSWLIRISSFDRIYTFLHLFNINESWKSKTIKLECYITNVHRYSFSKNREILYILASTANGYELFAFDYDKLITQNMAVEIYPRRVIMKPENYVK